MVLKTVGKSSGWRSFFDRAASSLHVCVIITENNPELVSCSRSPPLQKNVIQSESNWPIFTVLQKHHWLCSVSRINNSKSLGDLHLALTRSRYCDREVNRSDRDHLISPMASQFPSESKVRLNFLRRVDSQNVGAAGNWTRSLGIARKWVEYYGRREWQSFVNQCETSL